MGPRATSGPTRPGRATGRAPPPTAVGYSLWVDSVLTAGLVRAARAPPARLLHLPRVRARLHRPADPRRRASSPTRSSTAAPTVPPGTCSAGSGRCAAPAERIAHERVTLLASSTSTDVAEDLVAPQQDGGLRGALAQRLRPSGSGTDPNPALTAALRSDASTAIAGHVRTAAHAPRRPADDLARARRPRAVRPLAAPQLRRAGAGPPAAAGRLRDALGPSRRSACTVARSPRSATRTSWPSVDVVVPIYNEAPDDLDRCCASLLGAGLPGARSTSTSWTTAPPTAPR